MQYIRASIIQSCSIALLLFYLLKTSETIYLETILIDITITQYIYIIIFIYNVQYIIYMYNYTSNYSSILVFNE